MLLGVTMFGAEGSETEIAIPGVNRREDWSFEDLGFLLIMLAALVIFDLIKNVGFTFVHRLCAGEDIQDMKKVKILHKDALIPEKIDDDEGTFNLKTFQRVKLAPGENKLVSLGYSVELPRGTYGRLVSRNDLMLMGIEVGGGTIASNFRGEVLVNRSDGEIKFGPGDSVAELKVEKVADVKAKAHSPPTGVGALSRVLDSIEEEFAAALGVTRVMGEPRVIPLSESPNGVRFGDDHYLTARIKALSKSIFHEDREKVTDLTQRKEVLGDLRETGQLEEEDRKLLLTSPERGSGTGHRGRGRPRDPTRAGEGKLMPHMLEIARILIFPNHRLIHVIFQVLIMILAKLHIVILVKTDEMTLVMIHVLKGVGRERKEGGEGKPRKSPLRTKNRQLVLRLWYSLLQPQKVVLVEMKFLAVKFLGKLRYQLLQLLVNRKCLHRALHQLKVVRKLHMVNFPKLHLLRHQMNPKLHLLQYHILKYHLVMFLKVISKLLDYVVIPRLLLRFLVKLPSQKLLSYPQNMLLW
eukprot:s3834_g6.t1